MRADNQEESGIIPLKRQKEREMMHIYSADELTEEQLRARLDWMEGGVEEKQDILIKVVMSLCSRIEKLKAELDPL